MLTFRLPDPALLFDDARLRWAMAVALLMLENSELPNWPLASRPWPSWLLMLSDTTRATRPSSFMDGISTSWR
ncbi:hypothetical protein D3C80_1820750 [compost metagenome]